MQGWLRVSAGLYGQLPARRNAVHALQNSGTDQKTPQQELQEILQIEAQGKQEAWKGKEKPYAGRRSSVSVVQRRFALSEPTSELMEPTIMRIPSGMLRRTAGLNSK